MPNKECLYIEYLARPSTFYEQFFCTNVVSAAFSCYVLALGRNSYKKFVHLTLMKLTTVLLLFTVRSFVRNSDICLLSRTRLTQQQTKDVYHYPLMGLINGSFWNGIIHCVPRIVALITVCANTDTHTLTCVR